jgi:hypothetical protein
MLTQEEYDAKRQTRYDRLLAAAEKAQQDSDATLRRADQMSSVIPLGQPILVGHYSERRDRNYRERIHHTYRKGYDLYKHAQELKERAGSQSTAIFSDDPSAVDQIAIKIAKLEADQALWKDINKAYAGYLKNPASLETSSLSDGCKRIIREFKPDWSGDKPIPSFRLTNNNANIRRLKERAQVVARKQSLEDTERKVNGIKIEECPSENRLRLFFPGKPAESVRSELKSHGFRWAPTLGCWQAYYNANARYYADQITKSQPAAL